MTTSDASEAAARHAQERAEHEALRISHEHSDVTGGWLRPAVFGASDGLVSNFALIAGVSGGSDDSKTVLLAGLAGLAAGAFSMAAGEYISVRSQAEQAMAEIELERRELERNPAGRGASSSPRCTSPRGSSPELARQVARQLSRDPHRVLGVHVREELGISEDDLPSARLAAGSSFASFAVGALLPVLPYLFGATTPAAVAAAHAGGAVPVRGLRHPADAATVVVRRPAADGRRRAVAAAVTFGVGSLVGASGLDLTETRLPQPLKSSTGRPPVSHAGNTSRGSGRPTVMLTAVPQGQ